MLIEELSNKFRALVITSGTSPDEDGDSAFFLLTDKKIPDGEVLIVEPVWLSRGGTYWEWRIVEDD